MSAPVYIFGTGGHARDVAEVVEALGRHVMFVTRGDNVDPVRSETVIAEAEALTMVDADFAMGIGDNETRARVAHSYPHLRFPAFVHPEATLASDQRAAIGASTGTIVFAGARIMGAVSIGRFCIVNLNATISHDGQIADFVHLSPGAHLAGNVSVGEGAWIGLGAVVNQGTETRKLAIGARTVVGSGSVVLSDCIADAVYVGNPARKIR